MIISLRVRSTSDTPGRESKYGQKPKEIKLEVVGGRVGRWGKPPKRKANLKTSHKPLIYWNTTYSLTSNYCKGYTVCSQQDGAEHCLHSRCLAIPEKEDFAYFRMSSIPKKKRKKKEKKKKEDLHSGKRPINSLLH